MQTQVAVRDFPLMTKNSPRRVLVVDDEFLIRWSVTQVLEAQGYEVAEAGDGHGALVAIRESALPFDAVLLDFRLPDSNDLTLLKTIRGLTPSSSVIMITAHNSPELQAQAMGLGAFRVMNKPFEVDSLAALVEHACSASDSTSGAKS